MVHSLTPHHFRPASGTLENRRALALAARIAAPLWLDRRALSLGPVRNEDFFDINLESIPVDWTHSPFAHFANLASATTTAASATWQPPGLAWCCSKRTKSVTDLLNSSRICSTGSRGGTLLCRKRSALRRGSVQPKRRPCWESPGCLWQHRPADRQRIYRRRIRYRFGSFSVRRKSPMSAWRRSTFSTRKNSEH